MLTEEVRRIEEQRRDAANANRQGGLGMSIELAEEHSRLLEHCTELLENNRELVRDNRELMEENIKLKEEIERLRG